MKRKRCVKWFVVPLLVVGLAWCSDNDEPAGPTGPFDLTFEGGASFQVPHGDRDLSAVVVGAGSGLSGGPLVVATAATVVSASDDPSFSLSFPGVLTPGEEYEIHYWIDSNFGGGTAGTCDPPANDHQWAIDIGVVSDDVTITDTYRPADTELVCVYDLTFEGDARFQVPHGGHDLSAAVVRVGSGLSGGPAVVGTAATVVSASDDPSFSLFFPGVLTPGEEYEIHYWTDSNFGGGTAGTCDPPRNDHQWAHDIGVVSDDVTASVTHSPETEDVCSTFQ